MTVNFVLSSKYKARKFENFLLLLKSIEKVLVITGAHKKVFFEL